MNRHQKQALTFMLRREQGLAYEEPGKDVWSKGTNLEGNITYSSQFVATI
jgi:hypothetical protein